VYPGTATVNALLLSVAAKVMGVSDGAAVQKLQAKMMLPVRKPAKGMALVVAYQYFKRVFGHLNSSISSVAVSTFVKRTHELKGIGSWTVPSSSSTRRVLKQSPEECQDLLRADSFIKDAHGRIAMLDVLVNVIEELDATGMMINWTGPHKATRVIRCLYGHVANVTFRVCFHVPSLFFLQCSLYTLAASLTHLLCRLLLFIRSTVSGSAASDALPRLSLNVFLLLMDDTFFFILSSAFLLEFQVRAYLRNRAGLPSLLAGAGALNQGHQALFERELLLLHDILPKDAEVHDGLQLVDGGDAGRHLAESVDVTAAPSTLPPISAAPSAPPLQPKTAAAPSVPAVTGAAPEGVLLPLPTQPMRLEALLAHLARRGALPAPGAHATDAARHGQGGGERNDDWDEEEDDEIRPVAD